MPGNYGGNVEGLRLSGVVATTDGRSRRESGGRL